MEIYAEFFFIENLIADGIIAGCTYRLWRERIHPGRFIIGVFLMTCYSFGIFSPYSKILYCPLLKIVFSLMIVKILFPEAGTKRFVQIALTFFGTGIILGGGVSFLLILFGVSGMSSSGIVYIMPESYIAVIACLGAAFFFIYIFMAMLSELKRHEAVTVNVEINLGEKSGVYKALVDTGNTLRDPVDGLPVMIGEAEAVRRLIVDNYENTKIRIIPYSSVGTKEGTLLGVRIDALHIFQDKESYTSGPVVLAIYNGSFGMEDGCSIILHPDILKREAGVRCF